MVFCIMSTTNCNCDFKNLFHIVKLFIFALYYFAFYFLSINRFFLIQKAERGIGMQTGLLSLHILCNLLSIYYNADKKMILLCTSSFFQSNQQFLFFYWPFNWQHFFLFPKSKSSLFLFVHLHLYKWTIYSHNICWLDDCLY